VDGKIPDEDDTELLEPNVYLVGEGRRVQHRRPSPLYTIGDPTQNPHEKAPTQTRIPTRQSHPLPQGVEGIQPRIDPAQTKRSYQAWHASKQV